MLIRGICEIRGFARSAFGGAPEGGPFERVDVTGPDGQAKLLAMARARLG